MITIVASFNNRKIGDIIKVHNEIPLEETTYANGKVIGFATLDEYLGQFSEEEMPSVGIEKAKKAFNYLKVLVD